MVDGRHTANGVSRAYCAAISCGRVNEPLRIRVLTVDDHPLLQAGLAAVVRYQADMDLVGEAASGAEGLRLFREYRPDVTLMDLRLPDMSGVDATARIRAEWPDARIVILTTFDGDMDVRRALDAGARSYLLKSTPLADIVQTIRDVHAGKRRIPPAVAESLAQYYGDDALTARELEVLQQIAAGSRNKQVATTLGIADETVKVHVRHIMEKLGVADRTQAVAVAVRRGIIQL